MTGVRGRSLALGVALLLALAGCGGDDRTLEPGDVARVLDNPRVAGLADDPQLTLQLPTGTLGLAWSADADLLATITDDDGSSLRADDGGELVAVSWDVDTSATQVDGYAGSAVLGTAAHELVLVDGDRRTTLSPPDGGDDERALTGMAVLAVEDPDELALEVTFDGITQAVGPSPDDREVPAEAAALYEEAPAAQASLDCGADVFCRADVTWLPWVADQGWAGADRLWPVVRVEGTVPGAGGAVDVRATLDGVEPLSEVDLGTEPGRYHRVLVLPATEPAAVTVRVEATGDGADPVTGQAVLTP